MIPNIIYFNGLHIPSQDTSYIPPDQESYVLHDKLPILVKAWGWVEKATGHRWQATSFLRGPDAPSHVDGSALDISPEFNTRSKGFYSLSKLSDPVLYKREKLMRALQHIAASVQNDSAFDIGYFVEPDHIHIGLFSPEGPKRQVRVFKWGVVKPLYPDSPKRSKLPLITT